MKYDCKREEIKPVEEAPTQHTGVVCKEALTKKWPDFSLLQVAFA
jgi:hypothetical protein